MILVDRFRIAFLAIVTLSAWTTVTDASANTVHVVTAGGPTTFSSAYAAAQDGDVILVKAAPSHSFGEMLLGLDKSVTIVGEPTSGGAPPWFFGLSVGNLSASKRLTIRGCTFSGAFTMQGTFFILENVAGDVVLENLGAASFIGPNMSRIVNCANVTMTGCSIAGPNAQFGSGPAGIRFADSTVFVYGGTYTGGKGAAMGEGGPGVLVQGGFTYLHGVLAGGGNGGVGSSVGSTCVDGGEGGAGVFLQYGDPKVVSFGSLFVGGFGGPAGFCATSQPGAHGLPVKVASGIYGAYSDTARSIVATSPVRAGQATTLTIKGQPNEAVFLFVSPLVNPTFVPALKGALLPLTPFAFIPFGNMPPSGPLVVPVTIPPGILPPGEQALDVYVQTHVAGATGTGIVGRPTVLTILDPSL